METGLKIDTAEKRRQRAELARYAHAQNGVNALKAAFPNATETATGVIDTEDERRAAELLILD